MAETTPLSGAQQPSKLWKRVFAVAGIMTKLVTYDEKIMRVPYGDDKAFVKYSLFLVFRNRITTSAKEGSGSCCSSLGFGFARDGKRWGMGVDWGRLGGRVEEGFWVLVAVEKKKKSSWISEWVLSLATSTFNRKSNIKTDGGLTLAQICKMSGDSSDDSSGGGGGGGGAVIMVVVMMVVGGDNGDESEW
ncbi:hypothetical protein DVH24_029763 [Malus domestica]|uniref:Uncharacterized protein n=1 Tax=Malus domestica TaxID=3750 RepID=A0A498HYI9_MALDO|nr:hypothetical protein DVH24_029763 [Malus domestica]